MLGSNLVLATDQGNRPAFWVTSTKMNLFGPRPVQKPGPLPVGGPHRNPYPASGGFRRDWLEMYVPISGSAFRVFLFMVSFRGSAVDPKILILVCHCLFLDVLDIFEIKKQRGTHPAPS